MDQPLQRAGDTDIDPNPGSGSIQTPSAAAAFLLSGQSYHTRGGLVYIPPQRVEPTTGLTGHPPARQSFGTASRSAGITAGRRGGLIHLPYQSTSAVFSTPVMNLNSSETAGPSSGITQGMAVHNDMHPTIAASTTPPFSPAIHQFSWQPPDVTHGRIEEITQDFSGLGYHTPPERAPTTTTQPTSSRTPDPPSRPPVLLITGERSFHTAHMDANHPSTGHATPDVPPVAQTTPSTPWQSDSPRTSEFPLSPTSPTPAGTGRRRHSYASRTFGREIPQMLGEMRDVIGNLAVSVNGLKDVVSDLQAGQSTGSGSVPVRGSRRGRGSRGQRGRGRGGVRRGNQSQSTGGPVGDDYVADDESQDDVDHGEPRSKLRVSIVIHVAHVR